ncbi:hypothetical protein, unknown function [Leishmania donovani]|uniref:Uncharacterized protein n=1 Tax=Leishmania donovani TaxID=5661 RepID=E9BA98_LEIDO|nr:hypothetical protein, unknown function [Leishmania donovani]CBZ32171.1 hypothetical protein, unknown function [Leishmania donovani]
MRDGVHRFGPRGLARCVDCVEGGGRQCSAQTRTQSKARSHSRLERRPSRHPSAVAVRVAVGPLAPRCAAHAITPAAV